MTPCVPPKVGLGGLDQDRLVVDEVFEVLRGSALRIPVVHHLIQQLVNQDKVFSDRLLSAPTWLVAQRPRKISIEVWPSPTSVKTPQ
jgi:hypothetical protein